MITNKDLVAFGRHLEEQKQLDARVAIMARMSSLRQNIKDANAVIASLEKELAAENEKIKRLRQLAIPL